jgi:hypothetical protein
MINMALTPEEITKIAQEMLRLQQAADEVQNQNRTEFRESIFSCSPKRTKGIIGSFLSGMWEAMKESSENNSNSAVNSPNYMPNMIGKPASGLSAQERIAIYNAGNDKKCRIPLNTMTNLHLDLMDQAGVPYGILDIFPEL